MNGKAILNWVKSNLWVVIPIVLAVLLIPTMLYFSTKWNASIKQKVSSEVSGAVNKLSAVDVNYEFDPVVKGVSKWEEKMPPNEPTTRAIEALLKSQREEADAVRARALELNRAGKQPLITGPSANDRLFPDSADQSTRLRLLTRMAEVWPRAHDELLKGASAGMPPAPTEVLATLQRAYDDEKARRISGRVEQSLTADEEKAIRDSLGQRRLEIYQGAAARIRFYGDRSVFEGVTEWTSVQPPVLDQAWEWQHQYWVHEDIVAALAAANTDARGQMLPVFRGAVKRIESITVEPMQQEGGMGGPRGDPMSADPSATGDPSAVAASESAEVTANYTMSHTGRAGWPVAPNPVFDVRYANVRLVASANLVPRIMAELARRNFMTVVELDLERVDGDAALSEGFAYGDDELVRVTMRIETIWLRSWLKEFMPAAVRTRLGYPADAAAQPGEGDSAPVEGDASGGASGAGGDGGGGDGTSPPSVPRF